eukprot:313640-Rhodomonas_salina.2
MTACLRSGATVSATAFRPCEFLMKYSTVRTNHVMLSTRVQCMTRRLFSIFSPVLSSVGVHLYRDISKGCFGGAGGGAWVAVILCAVVVDIDIWAFELWAVVAVSGTAGFCRASF